MSDRKIKLPLYHRDEEAKKIIIKEIFLSDIRCLFKGILSPTVIAIELNNEDVLFYCTDSLKEIFDKIGEAYREKAK